jgi:3-oxoacyl-[acyl-carrier protein] reductase
MATQGLRSMNDLSVSKSLSGKVAVITGAGRGIGRAIACAYGRAGAAVVCSARSESELRETADLIAKSGGTVSVFVADVSDHAQMIALFDHASAKHGGVDIVVANAGMAGDLRPLSESDPTEWRHTVEVNVIGTYNTMHAAVAHLRRRGSGKIIVMGSGVRHRAGRGFSAYASAKAALWAMVQVLAVELQDASISVSELIPGPVRTAMTRFVGDKPFAEGEWMKEPEEVVPLAMFLATQPDYGPTAQSYSLMRRAG